jgi:hypothetical protein
MNKVIKERGETQKGKDGQSIYLWLYSPFVGPWPLFQFLNLVHSRYDFLEGGSAHRKAATYTHNNSNTE